MMSETLQQRARALARRTALPTGEARNFLDIMADRLDALEAALAEAQHERDALKAQIAERREQDLRDLSNSIRESGALDDPTPVELVEAARDKAECALAEAAERTQKWALNCEDALRERDEAREENARLREEHDGLIQLLREVWDSIPGTYDKTDLTVKRHAAALNAIGTALAGGPR